MGKKRHNVIPQLSTRVTATVSVALVLLLAGIAAFTGVAARTISDAIRESTGYTIVLDDNVTASQTDALRHRLMALPSTARVTFSSADDVMERWQQMVEEDIKLLAEVNPFSPEFEVNVKAQYASADSLEAVTAPLRDIEIIDDITVMTDMASEIESTFRSVETVLIIIAAALLIISMVLITNTVRLAVYSRRFAIHTMKLVGATPGFIRRPFLTANIVNGAIAGLIADLLLAGLLFYVNSVDGRTAELISPIAAAIIFGSVIVAGILICLTAATFATNKYLRQTYDEMFS